METLYIMNDRRYHPICENVISVKAKKVKSMASYAT